MKQRGVPKILRRAIVVIYVSQWVREHEVELGEHYWITGAKGKEPTCGTEALLHLEKTWALPCTRLVQNP